MSKQKYPQTQSASGKVTVGRRLRTGGYTNDTLHARRDLRRHKAEERQEVYDGLSTEEKFARIAKRRGVSQRESLRLMKLAS